MGIKGVFAGIVSAVGVGALVSYLATAAQYDAQVKDLQSDVAVKRDVIRALATGRDHMTIDGELYDLRIGDKINCSPVVVTKILTVDEKGKPNGFEKKPTYNFGDYCPSI